MVDAQHENSFTENELVNFAVRVAERGFDVEFLGDFSLLEDPALVLNQVRIGRDRGDGVCVWRLGQ